MLLTDLQKNQKKKIGALWAEESKGEIQGNFERDVGRIERERKELLNSTQFRVTLSIQFLLYLQFICETYNKTKKRYCYLGVTIYKNG